MGAGELVRPRANWAIGLTSKMPSLFSFMNSKLFCQNGGIRLCSPPGSVRDGGLKRTRPTQVLSHFGGALHLNPRLKTRRFSLGHRSPLENCPLFLCLILGVHSNGCSLKIQAGNREPRLWLSDSRARFAGRPGMLRSLRSPLEHQKTRRADAAGHNS
jgi:hypothetical protein